MQPSLYRLKCVQRFRPRQNSCHFAGNISKWRHQMCFPERKFNTFIRFYLNLLLSVQLLIILHWFMKWFSDEQRQAIIWTTDDPIYWWKKCIIVYEMTSWWTCDTLLPELMMNWFTDEKYITRHHWLNWFPQSRQASVLKDGVISCHIVITHTLRFMINNHYNESC